MRTATRAEGKHAMSERILVAVYVASDVLERLLRVLTPSDVRNRLFEVSLMESKFMKGGTYLFRYSDGTQEYFDPAIKQDGSGGENSKGGEDGRHD